MPEILGFTSKKMIFEIENWYFCVVFFNKQNQSSELAYKISEP
jgi:hypothetical protein